MDNPDQMRNLLGLALSESFEISTENSTTQKFSNDRASHTEFDTISSGKTLRQYSIICELGRGGMGVVYKAFDNTLQREVALKVLPTLDGFEKLIKEAKSIARLNHPNIIQVYEVCDEVPHFFAMELIHGISLDKFIQQNSRKLKGKDYFRKIVHIFISVAQALAFAHKKGIIHRDLKPENIMLDSNFEPKVMDFGIAQAEWEKKRTVDNDFAGTPMYMSPEQARRQKVSKASDIYSLGTALYEALTMRGPFQGDTVFNVMYQIIHDDPVRPRRLNPEIPADLEAICMKCLEKKSRRRYISMGAFAKDLTNFLENKPVLAKSPGR